MKVIIIGAGKVGTQLVESLLNEKHEITVIDSSQEVIDRLNDFLDVLAIRGNGVSSSLLKEAGCEHADLLIAVTDSDEANVVSCVTAKALGAKSVIARVRNPEYVRELEFMRQKLNIDYIINPELSTAYEIIRLLFNTHVSYTEDFARGKVRITEIQVDVNSDLHNRKIKDLKLPEEVIFTAIARGGEVIIPNGNTVVHARDTLYVMGERNSVDAFARNAGAKIISNKIRNVMITGGGRTSFYLARELEQTGVSVKIIEQNLERCRVLAEALNNTLVLHGDGTDLSLLQAEKIELMDAFVTLTGFDEENLLTALLAKQLGAKKVIAKISRSNYMSLLETIGVDNAVIPKLITARDILRIIRGGRIVSMSLLIGGRAEVLEIIAQEDTPIVDRPLKSIGIPQGVILGAILRQGKLVIPNGDSVVRQGDRVIVFTLENNMESVKKLFGEKGGKQTGL
ncbi:MAG: Trk system potassium transporter TrkA [Firmicutes bacterium]|nr:Trk system potassium transporter TrkA [Bacillota bacterium]